MSPRATAALSQHPVPAEALGECAGALLETAADAGASPDLLAVAVTPPLHGALEDIVGAVRRLLTPGAVIGAVAGGVLGGGRQADGVAALAVLAVWGRRCAPVVIDRGEPGAGVAALGSTPVDLFLLADPFSTDLGSLAGLLDASPNVGRTLVGLVGAGTRPGANRLVGDDGVRRSGAVGVAIERGAIDIRTAAGHEPLEPSWVVTGRTDGTVTHLSGVPAATAALGCLAGLDEARRERAESALALVVEPPPGTGAGPHGRALVPVGLTASGLVVEDAPATGATVRLAIVDRTAAERDLVRTVDGTEVAASLVLVGDARPAATTDARSDAALLAESTRTSAAWGVRSVGSLVRTNGVAHRLGDAALAVGALR